MRSASGWLKKTRGSLRAGLGLALAAWVIIPALLWADAPAWWAERAVLKTAPGTTPDDYAAVNQGQVRNIAKQAYEEMKEHGLIDPVAAAASTNPDDPARRLFLAWQAPATSTDDYRAINLGQLKNVAEPFYARLVDDLGYTGQPFAPGQTVAHGTRPWSSSTRPADNYALANIGQVKNLFSFDLSQLNSDTDNDGLPDAWELQHFGNLQQGSAADSDNDGLTNLQEYQNGTNPLADDSDNDGMPDGYEVTNGLNPLVDDSLEDKDGDRIPNIFEYRHQTAANDPASKPAATFIVDATDGVVSDTDNIYATIGEALEKVNEYEWDGTNYIYPNSYAVIEVKPGTYSESIYAYQPVAILRENGGGSSPAEIKSPDNYYTVQIDGTAVMDGITISHDSGAQGGGVYLSSYYNYDDSYSRCRLVNCIVRNNESPYGAGIYNSGSNLDLVHCTITKNKASSYGRGIYNEYGTVNLINTIVWGNVGAASDEIYADSTGSITATSSIIYGGEYGGLNVDPLLNPLGLLKAGSPAINLGQAAVGTPKDIQGESRVGLPDAGADEFIDSNNDGVPDNFGGGLATGNPDGDTLSNLAEYNFGSDPLSADGDNDGMEDGAEQIAGTDPRSRDTDGDGMDDGYEIANGLNPLVNDSLEDKDGDGVPNLWEAKMGTALNNASSKPAATYVVAASGGTHTTIQSAVDAISGGTSSAPTYAIIEVREGTYPENVYLNNSAVRVALLAKPVAPIATVEINGAASYYSNVLYIGQPAVVSGFSITRKLDPSRLTSNYGTGINIALNDTRARAMLVNCVIHGQRSSQAGALYINQGDVALRHVTMYDNLASVGAYYKANAAYVYQGTLRVENSIIWSQSGGATSTIYRDDSSATVTTAGSIVCGGECGGLNADPLLNPLGLLKAGSPAINLGQAAVGTPKDIQGESRVGLPDAGADEFTDSNNDGVPDNFGGGLATGNPDGDTLNNLAEYNFGSDPLSADTDNDGLEDGAEQIAGTDPRSKDTDGDGMDDGYEVANGLNPLVNDSLEDKDGDGVPNLWEAKMGTASNNASSKPVATYVVAASGGTHTTIQSAVNAISGGTSSAPAYAIIEIREGTYPENVYLNNSAVRVALLAKPVAPTATVEISGAASYYSNVLYLGQPAVVSGFSITRKLDAAQPAANHGTGINIALSDTKARALFVNCIIHGQRSSQAGALYINQGDVTLRHVTMYDNVASAGAYSANAAYLYRGALRVENSIVWSQSGGVTSTIYRDGGNATVTTVGSIVYGGEYGGLNADPLLNPLGLLRAGSPAINLGQSAVGTPKDIQGESRVGLPDAGADEFIDSNNDGVPDNFGGGLATGNPDGDTLNNLAEYNFGSDPTQSDTDHDNLEDGAEQIAGTDPRSNDTDNDGMDDGYEVANGLNPLVNDSFEDKDGDGVPNLWEAKRGTAANNASSKPTPTYIVAASGGTHTTIQSAVYAISGGTSAAPTYAIIEVREGIYPENVYLYNSAARVALLAKPTTPTATVEINGGASYYSNVLYISQPTFISGFLITRKLDPDQPANNHGTGINIALSSPNSRASFTNCFIHGHRSSEAGALYINQGDVTLRHVTMYDNLATAGTDYYANAISIYQGALRVENSIIWSQSGGATNTIYRNANYASVTTAGSIVYGGEYGGLNTNPLLNPLGLLKAGSPAINLGQASLSTPMDIQGEARAGVPDAGADEFIDSNNDGVPDNFGGGLATGNPDGDTLNNLAEYNFGSDPLLADRDNDGLEDGAEQTAGTDPRSSDTDNDGMGDGYEVTNGLNPLIDDSLEDMDCDGYPNVFEFKNNSIANDPLSTPIAAAFLVDSSLPDNYPTSNRYKTIQAAIDSATHYTIIRVIGGTYSESITTPNGLELLVLRGSGLVEINSTSESPTLSIYGKAVVNGIVLTHKFGTKGQGCYISTNEHVRLINCVIRDNHIAGSYSRGGGIYYNSNRGMLDIIHCAVIRNGASGGGNALSTQGGIVNLTNSILWDEGGAGAQEIYQSVDYSGLAQGDLTINSSIIYGGERGALNCTQSPVLASGFLKNATAFTPTGNPAIDSASTSVQIGKFDLLGVARPVGAAPDMGAIEYTDSDNDGVIDSWELNYFQALTRDLAHLDFDADGVMDLDEYKLGLNPKNNDSDADGLHDGIEISQYHTDPLNADSDSDSLTDGLEVTSGLDPANPDSDFDGMNDGWEYSWKDYAQKPNPTLSDAANDADGDSISNYEEMVSKTNPCVYNEAPVRMDTDGDGLYDDEEINEYLTDPHVANPHTEVTYATINGSQAVANQDWITNGTSRYLYAYQGQAEFNFEIPGDNTYFADIAWQVKFDNSRADIYNVQVLCDGLDLGYQLFKNPGTQTQEQIKRVILPHLRAGTHRITLVIIGASPSPSLQINRITIKSFGNVGGASGPSSIMQSRLNGQNKLLTDSTTSATSPLCLEGMASYAQAVAINGEKIAHPALKGQWYCDLPLKSDGVTAMNVSFENGAKQEQLSVQWIATNIFTANSTITLRKGDSLKLYARPSGKPDGAMTIKIGSQVFTGSTTSPQVYQFNTPGQIVVTGEYDKQVQTITVNVITASFPGKAMGIVGTQRTWSCPAVPFVLPFEADAELACSQSDSSGVSQFSLTPRSENIRHVVVRASDGGPIVAVGEVQGFRYFSWNESGIEKIGVSADGRNIYEMTVRLSIPIQEGIGVRINTWKAGSTFDDGSIVRTWTAADADANGTIKIKFLVPPSSGGPCHRFSLLQGSTSLN